jgi:NifB/MoaA-like Fe-S oxidoreductase
LDSNPKRFGKASRASRIGVAFNEIGIAMSLDLGTFARGFIATLAMHNLFSIQPKNPAQIRAFHEIRNVFDAEVEKLRASETETDWLYEIAELRNRLSPSTSGHFDQLETAFRDLQLSLTESPNLSYEDIDFTISLPFAQTTLERFSTRERELIEQAVGAYLKNIAA